MQVGTVRTAPARTTVVVKGEAGLVDVRTTAASRGADAALVDASLRELIAAGPGGKRLLELARGATSPVLLDEATVEFRPPVLDPPRIFCVGRNYEEHAREGNADVSAFPMIFLKPATTLSGHDQIVTVPASTDKVDWEGEIAVIIGRGGRYIDEGDAWEHIFGLTVANDLTARDWQRRTTQFDAGKMFDGFGPLGPMVVTLDEIDAASLKVATYVNGELMQTGSVRDMVFSIQFLVSYLSQAVELLPGDVIMTGTPSGVGYARTPPVFLQHGDAVEVIVEGLGRLRNQIHHVARYQADRPSSGKRSR